MESQPTAEQKTDSQSASICICEDVPIGTWLDTAQLRKIHPSLYTIGSPPDTFICTNCQTVKVTATQAVLPDPEPAAQETGDQATELATRAAALLRSEAARPPRCASCKDDCNALFRPDLPHEAFAVRESNFDDSGEEHLYVCGKCDIILVGELHDPREWDEYFERGNRWI